MAADTFRAALERSAKRMEFEVEHFGPPATTTGQMLLEDAAALRQLAGLLDECERHVETSGTTDEMARIDADLIARLAAGPTREGGNG